MDDRCTKVTAAGAMCSFNLVGQGYGDSLSAPSTSKAEASRSVIAGEGRGGVADSAADPRSLQFGTSGGYGPRFDIPGPMMRTVRDPALSLIALDGLDPEGPVMVEIPPVADSGQMRNASLLAGSRVGFASEYVSGDFSESAEHSAQFAWVLRVLQAAGVQLVPVPARLEDESRHFTLDRKNEINDRIHENRLDVLVSEASSAAFHRASTAGNPRVCVPVGIGDERASILVWFYGAQWAGERLATLVQEFQRLLSQEARVNDMTTPRTA